MNLWNDAMVRASVQGTILTALVWLVCRAAGSRLDSGIRKALWWLVCLKLVITFAWITPLTLRVLPDSPVVSGNLPAAIAEARIPGITQLDRATAEPGGASAWPSILMALWALGALAMVVRLGIGAWKVRLATTGAMVDDGPVAGEARRLAAAHGLRVSPRILRSPVTTSPFATGWWRPTIVLPEDFEMLDEGERRMALAHEIAHLRRWDPVLNVVPEIARVLFFFLPPVWLACREWAAERETVCDQEALSATGATPRDYREMLLKVAMQDAYPMGTPALGATAEFGLLRRRIERLGRATGVSILLGAASMAVALPALVPWQLASAEARGAVSLVNPGFEEGLDDAPAGWARGVRLDGVRYVWDREVAHSGRASLSIQKRVERYFPIAEWTQVVPVPPGAAIVEFTAWVKAEKSYKSVLDVQFATEEGIGGHEWVAYVGAKELNDPPETFDWRKMGGVVAIPPGTKEVVLSLQDYGPGKVWFDDVQARFSKQIPQPKGR